MRRKPLKLSSSTLQAPPVRGVQLPLREQAVEVAEGLAAAETASEKATVAAGLSEAAAMDAVEKVAAEGGHIVREAKEGFYYGLSRTAIVVPWGRYSLHLSGPAQLERRRNHCLG